MPEASQRLVDTDGTIRDVPAEKVAGFIAEGWHAPTEGDVSRSTTEAAREADFGGASGAAKAIGYGLARGATLGLSDVAFRAGGASAEHLRGIEKQNPALSTGS